MLFGLEGIFSKCAESRNAGSPLPVGGTYDDAETPIGHTPTGFPCFAGLWKDRTIHIFIIEITRRGLTYRGKPLRTVRSHPNAVPGRDWVPGVFQSINSQALQHKEAMLHDMSFYEGQVSAGVVFEDVYRQIKGRIVWQKNLEQGVFVAEIRLGNRLAFVSQNDLRKADTGKGHIFLRNRFTCVPSTGPISFHACPAGKKT